MAWPRMKNSRSSAEPGIHPHEGVQATVTPAPDAEPPAGSGQNTGVGGTRHGVVENPAASRPGPGGGRLPRPIRYAHAGTGRPASDEPAPAAAPTVPAAPPAPPDRADEPEPLTGIVLPPLAPAPPQPARKPRAGDGSRRGAGGTRPAGSTRAGDGRQGGEAPRTATGAGPGTGTPVNEGLGIFGGVATTEATDDVPPRDAGHPARHRPQRAAPPAAEPESPRGTPVGATWNQTIAQPPVPSGAAEESKPLPLGRVLGLIRRGGPADRTGGPGLAGGPGEEQPRVSVRDLPPDVQIGFWRTRAILIVVVGAVTAALTRNWEIAVTLAILAGIVDTVRRSRNPNLHLYLNGAKHPGAHKQTRGQLNKMRREGYFTLDARAIPNSREVIDHLVVGPTGVYAIDSEKWDPRLPIRTINGRRLYLGPESQKDRLDHAVWEASQATEILSAALGYDVIVRPALAIYGPKVPWDVATIRNVDVFTGTALGKYLKQRYRMRARPGEGVPSLTREEVRTIYDTAARMLPDASPSRTTSPVG
jgi:hypothetical protein